MTNTDKVRVPISHLTSNPSMPNNTGLPSYYSAYEPAYGHNFPIWRLNLVPTMIRDSRVTYGLQLLKGPIKSFTVFLPEENADSAEVHQTLREQGIQFAYTVKSDDQEVSEFILKTLNRFWENGLEEYLTCIEWGYSCNQIIYKFDTDEKGKPDLKTIEFDKLSWYDPMFVRAITYKHKLIGASIYDTTMNSDPIVLRIPKLLWGVHNKRVNRLFGQSRLYGCFIPWHETWTTGGARDVRRLWFQKNSFDSGEIRFPIGKTTLPDNTEIDNRDLAIKILGNIRSGGGRVLPSDSFSQGKEKQWEYIPPISNVTPQGLMEYPETLRKEILEGLGIPPEVVESDSDGGFGSATGRKVPMTVYYSTLSNIVSDVLNTLTEQCIKYMVELRYGKNIKFSIEKVIPLKSELGIQALENNMQGAEGGSEGKTDPIEKTVQGEHLGS